MTNRADKTWNLTPLLKSDDDPSIPKKRQAIKQAHEAFIKSWRDDDSYLTDAAALRRALDEYEALQAKYGNEGDEGFYFSLRYSQDQTDSELKARNQKITDFGLALLNDIQFFELKLGQAATAKQAEFLQSTELEPYRHFLEQIFAAAKNQLSEPEERIMNLKSTPAYANWVRLTESFLSKETRETLLEDGTRNEQSYEQLLSLCSSPNPKVRDEAAGHFNDILAKLAPVAEAELNSILADKKVNDELRGFDRPDASRHLRDDVDAGMVDALIEAVSARNDIAQRFYKLKAHLLGLPKLKYHERNIEYGKVEKDYPYEEALELVGNVFHHLEPRFADILRQFEAKRQIDVYPRAGKHGGAYCANYLKNQPTYVLLNYTDKLRDVTTLAHEMGHAVHAEYRRVQNALNFDVPMATAEVASQYMEDFVLDELLARANDELRLAVMMNKLNDTVSSIFRQVACYKFEFDLHQQFRKEGYLSLESIGQLFQQHMGAYMGPAVEQSPGSQNWWVYWSHIRTFFYVYAYAGGLLIAKSLQNQTRQDPAFVKRVEQFLAAGSSRSPKDIFGDIGIDITSPAFWDAGLDEIQRLLDDAETLAKKLGQIGS